MGGSGAVEEALTVVILAAGRSSRMGFPKALAEVQGEAAILRILRLCQEDDLDRVRVVLGHHAEQIRPLLPAAVEVVVNEDPDRGQSSSVRLGMAGIHGPACLWPVDHAAVEPTTLLLLQQTFGERPPGVEVVAPSNGAQRGHPVLVGAEVVQEFQALDDDRPAHQVVRRLPERILHVRVRDPAAFRDMDTPGDWEALR